MNFIATGIFVKEKDIARIWDQNGLPSQKDNWEIEKNRCYLQRNSTAIAALYSCATSRKGIANNAAIYE